MSATKRFLAAAVLGAMTLFMAAGVSTAIAGGGGEGAVPGPHVNWTDFGYKSKDVDGGKLDDGETHMAPPLVAQMLNFAIFAGILILVAGPKIKKSMAKRHNEVKKALEEAASMKADAAAKLAEYTERISAVDKEVDDLVKTIKADADAERARIVAEAEAQAATLKRDAEERIAASIGRARAALESEVVAAAVAAAEGVLRKQVNNQDHNNLVEHFITSIEDGPAPEGGGDGGGSGGDTPTPPAPAPVREKRESKVDDGWG